MRKIQFDTRQFIKNVAVIAIPIALQNLLTTTATMVDTIMLAPLGERTIGAVGLCAQFASLLFSCYWGFVGGGMLFFAQYWGARDDEGIEKAYGITLTCMMAVASVCTVLALFFPNVIMSLYTDKKNLHSIGISYLMIDGFAYIPQVYAVAMSSLLRSTERVKIPLFGGISSVCTNVLLNYLLIYGKFGLPRMGVKGAALASVASSLVNVAVIWYFAIKSGYPYLFCVKKHFQWDRTIIRSYIKKCFPIICNELFLGFATMLINVVLGRQAESAIAALAVFRTLEGFVIGFFSGFSNAASVLVGKSVGEGNLSIAYERAKRLVPMCAITIFSVGLVLLAVHNPLLHGMSLSGKSYETGTGILVMFCFIAVVRMCNWIQNDTYRSAGDSTYGTILEIIFMYLLVLPVVYLVGIKLRLHIYIVFACCYCDEPIRFILMQIHMYSGKWIKPVTEAGQKALSDFRVSNYV